MDLKFSRLGVLSDNENMLKSIYTKSADLKNFLTTWKESVQNSNFDLSQALQEKAEKIQTAMCIFYSSLYFNSK